MYKLQHFTLLICICLIYSCTSDTSVLQKDAKLSDSEINAIIKLGINPENAIVFQEHVIVENDIALERANLTESVATRSLAVYPQEVPYTSEMSTITLYRHPSFYTAPPEWQTALDSALHYYNGLPHCALNIELSDNPESDIILLVDNTTDPEIPPAYTSFTAFALGTLPTNGQIGKYISLGSDYFIPAPASPYYDRSRTKVLLHEIGHNIGFAHNCKVGSGFVGNVNALLIETTSNNNWNNTGGRPECDSTSVMFGPLNDYINGTSQPSYPGGPILANDWYCNHPQGYNQGGAHYFNVNDTFSCQALYPCRYFPFSLDIIDCYNWELTEFNTYPNNGSSNPYVYRFELDYNENNFVPYEIKIDLLLDQQVIYSYTTYRYWPQFLDVPAQLLNQYTGECMQINMELTNWKGDVTNFDTTNCCVIVN